MATTARGFRYPAGTDTPDVPRDLQYLALDIDNMFKQGLFSARPAPGAVGREYFATDTGDTWLDIGASWVLKGSTALVKTTDARLSDQRVPVDGSVTNAKLGGGAVDLAKVNASLKGSSATPADETLRSLGTAAHQAAAGNDSRLPTASEKAALAGTRGVPQSGNKYVTDSALDRHAKAMRASSVLATTSGAITYDGGGVAWANRIIFMPLGRDAGSDGSGDGYFEILMPANGSVLTGVGGAPNKTVTGGRIPLAGWDAIYAIPSWGATGNSSITSASLVVVSYTVAYDIPDDWILVCTKSGDADFVRWCTGHITALGETAQGAKSTQVHRDSHAAGGADEFRPFNQSNPNPNAGGRLSNPFTWGANGERTRFIKNLGSDASHRRLHLFHMSRRQVTWNTGQPIEVIVRTAYYDGSSYSRSIIQGGYGIPFRVKIMETVGPNAVVPTLTGTATITGDLTETAVVLDLPQYTVAQVEVRYMKVEVARPFTDGGQISFEAVGETILGTNPGYAPKGLGQGERVGHFIATRGAPGSGSSVATAPTAYTPSVETLDVEGWYDAANVIPEYKPKLPGWYRFFVEFCATAAPPSPHWIDVYVSRNFGLPTDNTTSRRAPRRWIAPASIGIQDEMTWEYYNDGFSTFSLVANANIGGVAGYWTFSGYYIGDTPS